MTPKQIKNKVVRLKQKMLDIHQQIVDIQTECTHPNVNKQHRGDTGNWSRSDDCYWIEYKCPDCEKFWTEDVPHISYYR